MSKKIIYLLSLLMALSLVFASCKKNAAGTGSDLGSLTPPTEEDNTDQANQNTGLFENWDDIPKTEVIKRTTVFKSGEDFYRNPVVVSMGDGRIFLFSEVRYKREGAANDVGIDGGGVVDIVYKASKNSGITFDSLEKVVNKDNTITTTIAASHGAPNVFVLGTDKIVVVATSGGGIGRTAEKAVEGGTTTKPASKVDYIVGNVSDTIITWSEWKEVTVSGESIYNKIKNTVAGGPSSAKVNFNQYGTASGRGLVDNNKMVLSLVIANQGDTKDVYELMGRYVLTGTESGGTVTWTELAQPVAYAADANKKLGDWKETQVFSGNSTTPNFIVVPSPWSGRTTMRLGKAFASSTIPTDTTIKASEGSAGSIDLSKKWYGKSQYTIENSKIKENTSTEALIMHVQDLSANLTMYVVNSSDLTVKGTGFKINDVGKASSIDVLPDGTIITGAEEGGQAKNYYGVFTRYSQYYIADKTGNQ